MTITLGTPNEVNELTEASGSSDRSFFWLTETKGVAVAYYDDAGDFKLGVWEMDRSGETITLSGPVEVGSFTDYGVYYAAAPIDENHVLVVYRSADAADPAIFGRVYNTSSGFGTAVELLASGVVDDFRGFEVSILNDGAKGLLVYRDQTNSNYGTAIAFTISGTTVGSPGSAHVWYSTAINISNNLPQRGETDAVIVVYENGPNDLVCKALTLSGTTISSGSEGTVTTQDTPVERLIIPLDLANSRYTVIYRNLDFTPLIARVQVMVRSGSSVATENSTGGVHDTSEITNLGASSVVHGAFVLASEVLISWVADLDGGNFYLSELVYDTGSGWSTAVNYDLGDGTTENSWLLSWTGYNSNSGSMFYFDGSNWQLVTLTSSLAPPPTANAFRLLGIAGDTETLYLVGLKDEATLQLYRYTLGDLAENGTIPEFGTTDDSEIDALTRGLLPAARPGADGVLFLFGRDGGDNQVQISDDGGDTFSDLSDGSWSSSKMCISLLPDPLRPDDMIAVFADDDIYRSSVIGAPTWVKMGDSPVTLRRAARHPLAPAELLLAAQAADSLRFTHNFGVSFADISDTVGTVNTIEVSREPAV